MRVILLLATSAAAGAAPEAYGSWQANDRHARVIASDPAFISATSYERVQITNWRWRPPPGSDRFESDRSGAAIPCDNLTIYELEVDDIATLAATSHRYADRFLSGEFGDVDALARDLRTAYFVEVTPHVGRDMLPQALMMVTVEPGLEWINPVAPIPDDGPDPWVRGEIAFNRWYDDVIHEMASGIPGFFGATRYKVLSADSNGLRVVSGRRPNQYRYLCVYELEVEPDEAAQAIQSVLTTPDHPCRHTPLVDHDNGGTTFWRRISQRVTTA